jgi:D-glycero-alpha-D-manno-heptose-7-phosphate kinase
MLIRSVAPLRIGLAGGGTDVSPYSDLFGGAVLNATISLYAYVTIEPGLNERIEMESLDKKEAISLEPVPYLPMDGRFDLLKGVYNRIVKDFNKGTPLNFKLSSFVDAPAGSGLGTSSTLVVATLGAFSDWLSIPFGEYDLAHMAFEIERIDLCQAGGKQDQYAASFGGFNFMEFYDNQKVVVNPLKIKYEVVEELQHNLILYYTGTSRLSYRIIEAQVKNVQSRKEKSIDSMHKLKEQAIMMKEAILRGKTDHVGEILHFGWQHKKQIADGISNPIIDEIYETATKFGATGGKISGAGGGGFMMFYCPRNTKYRVMEALEKFGGEFKKYQFTDNGVKTWRV